MDTLCRRYGCLPSQLLAEPADYLLRMLALLSESGVLGEEMSRG